MIFPEDAILEAVTQKIALPALRSQPDLYLVLLESVVSQQLSVKAADTIFNRFLGIFEDKYPHPTELQALDLAALQAVGLSKQKATYLQAVADFHLQNGITGDILADKTDTDIIAYLTPIKGVGKWTVEMMLIFALERPDVFAVDDLGIRQAMVKLYGLTSTGKELSKEMQALAEQWRPNRSLACRYLWRWKDTL